MPDVTQILLRSMLLAALTALFVAAWSADAAQTQGMTLVQRNRSIVPAHAMGRPNVALASRNRHAAPTRSVSRVVPNTSTMAATVRETIQPSTSADGLTGGTYRVIHEDGRVEWLMVIGPAASENASPVIQTSLGGEPVHLIRVSDRADLGVRVR